jgi:hypothetical protein
LTARRDRKRKGSPQWIRLGELLTARRAELDPAYFDRAAFARDRGINLKLAQDIENNGRENFTPLTLRDMVAPAYAVTYESVIDALDSGDLVALPGTPPHKRRGPRLAPATATAPPPDPDEDWLPPLSAEETARARPYSDEILLRRGDWRAAYASAHPGIEVSEIPEAPGAELFPDSPEDAAMWDGRASSLSVRQRVWLIAALRAREAAARGARAG